jgi:UDP-glucose 4-epimerase
MRWLITGGCGFIGTNLVAHLLTENPNSMIRVLDNLTVGAKEDLGKVTPFLEILLTVLKGQPQGVELVIGDIRDPETCLKCCEGIDNIVHLAASTGVGCSIENPRLDMEINVAGTFNMLEAAKKKAVKRFIFASSGAAVGEVEPPIHEKMAARPVSPYGAGKLAGEAFCSAFNQTFGIETISLRFSNVYGPGSGRKNSVVAKFIRQAMRGEALEIYGDGTQTRDFIYIDDLIKAIVLSVKKDGIRGEIIQIATSKETTISELVDTLLSTFKDSDFPRIKVRHSQPRIGDVKRNFSDTSKVRKRLGWTPEINLSEGLRRTVEWFVEQEGN